mmetsp:Transcript_2037/g.2949  ORF Transcript_2037/g.2949 Transcript_2037/m.2949 type:complete len:593 (-) Transcript_2037:1288-3066(-)
MSGFGNLAGLGNIAAKIEANEQKLKEIRKKREVALEESTQKLLEQERKNALERKKKKEQLEKAKAAELKQRQAAKKLRRKELNIRTPKIEVGVPDSSGVSSFKVFKMKSNKVLLFCGSDSGTLHCFDAENNFELLASVLIKKHFSLSHLSKVNCTTSVSYNVKKQLDKTVKPNLEMHTEQDEYLVVSAGCDLFLLSFQNFLCFHKVEDAFTNEIQTMISYSSQDVNSSFQDLVACGSLDFTIKCWNAKTWECLFSCTDHEDSILCMAFWIESDKQRYHLCSGSDDSTIKVWDMLQAQNTPKASSASKVALTELKEMKTLKKHSEFVSVLAVISPMKIRGGGNNENNYKLHMVSGSADFTILIWNENYDCIRTLNNNMFPNHIGIVGGGLFMTLQDGNEEHEDVEYLQGWSVGSTDPMKWVLIPKARTKMLKCNCLVAETIEQDEKQKSFLACASEDEVTIQIWTSPFPYKPSEVKRVPIINAIPTEKPNGKRKAVGVVNPSAEVATTSNLDTSKSSRFHQPKKIKPEAKEVTLPDPTPKKKTTRNGSSSIPIGAKFPGDLLAKDFIENILKLNDLSPDMTRLLNVCLSLHEN